MISRCRKARTTKDAKCPRRNASQGEANKRSLEWLAFDFLREPSCPSWLMGFESIATDCAANERRRRLSIDGYIKTAIDGYRRLY